eukprot:TRINITY_DN30374_c0_g2_i1.p1 TRINITY_DN30374_c0_g2~~TRINITY_DN30374_c0_g2_i1.p1  ORF type:complete len:201 (-),score=16.43 TRINITY_DN30374_c0_g2_i1:131-733(-)
MDLLAEDKPLHSLRGVYWNVNSMEGNFSELDLCLDRVARALEPKRRLISPRTSIREMKQRPLFQGSPLTRQTSRSLVKLRSCSLKPAWGIPSPWAHDFTDEGVHRELYNDGASFERDGSAVQKPATLERSRRSNSVGAKSAGCGVRAEDKAPKRPLTSSRGFLFNDGRHDLPYKLACGGRGEPSRPHTTSSYYSGLRALW